MKKKKECQKCEEYLQGWQRAKADYANLQKESEKNLGEFRKYAQEDLLQQLFPLVDYFKQGFSQVPEEEMETSWMQGIKYIQDNLEKILEENGVEEIKTVGEKFDPELHEAVKGEGEEIIEEIATGFKLNGQVVRPAKVIIK